ncbi:PRONE domain protein [Raphanus sativus]|nr:PRONE domain protein [Raphanus sativus]
MEIMKEFKQDLCKELKKFEQDLCEKLQQALEQGFDKLEHALKIEKAGAQDMQWDDDEDRVLSKMMSELSTLSLKTDLLKIGAVQKHGEIRLQVKERMAKLLLGEDMSGSGEGVCPAISNAITNLYGN